MPKILLVGHDIRLLNTRTAVLKKTGDVSYCAGSQAVSRVETERPDLVVLCHSLLEGEVEEIADVVRECCKPTKVLMILSGRGAEFPIQDEKFDAMCLSHPERLILCVSELVGRDSSSSNTYDE